MKLANFTLEQLKALPLRAIVAFAARCAAGSNPSHSYPRGIRRGRAAGRRSRPPSGWPNRSRGARTRPPTSRWSRRSTRAGTPGANPAGSAAAAAVAQAAHAAASAWHAGPGAGRQGAGDTNDRGREVLGALTHVTADLAALNAYTAAADAFVSVGYRNEDFVNAALSDYDTLVRLNLGRYPEPGDPVDPSPGGPLGPL